MTTVTTQATENKRWTFIIPELDTNKQKRKPT